MASPCGCSIEDGPASSKYFLREVYSEQQIQQRVKELADQIALDYKLHSNVCYENELVLIVILKGGMFFLCDLARALAVRGVHHRVEVMSVATYGDSTTTTGAVRVVLDLKKNIENKHVLVVEDIVDTGFTLNWLKTNLLTRKPSSFKIAALVSKDKCCRKVEVSVDYLGFEFNGTDWLGGYGLDYAEHFRTLPSIMAIKPEVYTKK